MVVLGLIVLAARTGHFSQPKDIPPTMLMVPIISHTVETPTRILLDLACTVLLLLLPIHIGTSSTMPVVTV